MNNKNKALILSIAVNIMLTACGSTPEENLEVSTNKFDSFSYANRLSRAVGVTSIYDTEIAKDSLLSRGLGGGAFSSQLAQGTSLFNAGLTGLAFSLLSPEDAANRVFMVMLKEIEQDQNINYGSLMTSFDEDLKDLIAATYNLNTKNIESKEGKSYNAVNRNQLRKFIISDQEFCAKYEKTVIFNQAIPYGPRLLDDTTEEEKVLKIQTTGRERRNQLYGKENCGFSFYISAYHSGIIDGSKLPWMNNDKLYIPVKIDYIASSIRVNKLIDGIENSDNNNIYLYTPPKSYSFSTMFHPVKSPYKVPAFTSKHGVFLFVKPET